MNTSVSFEIAKLLKEKGFNLKVITFYDYERLSTPFDEQRQVDGLINYNPINWNSVKNHYTSAPTIAEVIMWLYEKHGIWISVIHQHNKFFWKFGSYQTQEFNSPTESYEAAIDYTLNNLI